MGHKSTKPTESTKPTTPPPPPLSVLVTTETETFAWTFTDEFQYYTTTNPERCYDATVSVNTRENNSIGEAVTKKRPDVVFVLLDGYVGRHRWNSLAQLNDALEQPELVEKFTARPVQLLLRVREQDAQPLEQSYDAARHLTVWMLFRCVCQQVGLPQDIAAHLQWCHATQMERQLGLFLRHAERLQVVPYFVKHRNVVVNQLCPELPLLLDNVLAESKVLRVKL